MPNNPLTVDEALDRLTVAARNGNRAKRRLAAKLAGMTPTQLLKVKPEAFARLGPTGLQLFAVASRTMRTVEPAPTKPAWPVKQAGPLAFHAPAGEVPPCHDGLRRGWGSGGIPQ
jgi:hypothetical protein